MYNLAITVNYFHMGMRKRNNAKMKIEREKAKVRRDKKKLKRLAKATAAAPAKKAA